MTHDISSYSQYRLPKWQAQLKNPEHHFRWPNGQSITSLWELRQSLQSIEDQYLRQLTSPDHHIANWIEFSVKDEQLAGLLRQTGTSRWAMLLALEKHMMRSLSIPYYLATRWLAPASSAFVLQNGTQFNSLVDMYSQLKDIDNTYIEPHLSAPSHNFSVWVKDSIGDTVLADMLESLNNTTQLEKALSVHMDDLEYFSQLRTPDW